VSIYIGLCPSLGDPDNGMIECSLGPDGVPTEGDVCVYLCDDGYIVSGSGDRTCQSDGTWTGSEPTCERCKLQYGISVFSKNIGIYASTSLVTHTQHEHMLVTVI